MKKLLLLLALISTSWTYSMEVPQHASSSEKTITLCNADTCVEATISSYNASRDELEVQKLIEENRIQLPHITPELLAPYFSHKTETLDQSAPNGMTIAGDITYCSHVLRDKEKALGVIAYMINAMQKPTPTITGNIVLISVEPSYQDAGAEQLIMHALQDIRHKKSIVVNMMTHEDDACQRSILEKMGFIDNTPQIKAMAERVKKSKPEGAPGMPENQGICYYMKMLDENITEEMKNPTPIESSLLNVTKANFEHEVTGADEPVVVDVYTDWCGPCRQLAPIFEEVATAQTTYKFVRFNCKPEEQELAKELGIEAFPTILFVKGGKVVGKETGFMSKEILQQKLAEHFNS